MTDELDKQLDMIDFVSVMRVQNEVPGYGSERIVEIRLKLEDKAKQAIQALIDRECNKAREIFIPVKGYEGLYEVSNTGKVRSIARGRNTGVELRQNVRVRKYLCVQLSKENTRKSYNVHRLVAEAFISNPHNKRTVNHKDGNPTNNNVDNLEWATYSENELHSYATLGKVNGQAKLTTKQANELISLVGKVTEAEAANRYGISQQRVHQIWASGKIGNYREAELSNKENK